MYCEAFLGFCKIPPAFVYGKQKKPIIQTKRTEHNMVNDIMVNNKIVNKISPLQGETGVT
ncbi:MAG: hypothetical protein LBQ28_04240 [Prevotellaceae bacterium]|jgi:hypothetical protein|nr:hypothetical protein [Prevotellaceae bacterium]